MNATIPRLARPTSRLANEWVDKTLATKKAKLEKQGAGGIVLNQKTDQKKQ